MLALSVWMLLELVGFESSGYRDLGMAVLGEKVNFRRYWSGGLVFFDIAAFSRFTHVRSSAYFGIRAWG